jgi:spore maturation protein CgeB
MLRDEQNPSKTPCFFQLRSAILISGGSEKEGEMEKLRRIDLFTNPKGQYGVLMRATLDLQRALIRAGIQSNIYNILEQSRDALLEQLERDAPDCTAGFNVILDDHIFFDLAGIPNLSIIVDCATYYPELVECRASCITFVEEDSCEFFQRSHHPHVWCLPHAIGKEQLTEELKAEVLASHRDIDLVFCGSYFDSQGMHAKWEKRFSTRAVALLEEIAEAVLASQSLSHIQAFLQAKEANPFFMEELAEKSVGLFDIMSSLELYIRGCDRIRLMKAVEGEVHLFGSETDIPLWQKALERKGVVYHGPKPYDELFSLFLRSKVVLHSLPTIKRGYHERLFLALAAGASVLASDAVALDMLGAGEAAILPYLSPHYDGINRRIARVLASEPERLSQVCAVRERISQEHTWDARVSALMTTLPPAIAAIRRSFRYA